MEADQWTRIGKPIWIAGSRRLSPRYGTRRGRGCVRPISPGDRKSVQPMAARAGEVGYDQLHHFVAAGVWDSAPFEAALLKEADGLVGDDAGFLVIDDAALSKKGRHSVGVAPQYASSLGKTAQLSVAGLGNVSLARGAGDGGPAALPARELDR